MVERIEDLNLPQAVISRVVKEALPTGIKVSKDAQSAITRAASVFILYLTSTANTMKMKNKHKIISAQYIFDALEETEFENFIPPLKEALEAYKQTAKDKKDKKKDESDQKKDGSGGPDEEMDTEVAEADDQSDGNSVDEVEK